MKKIFVGILTMVYMIVSSGMVMEIHYCMGKKAGQDLYTTKNVKCPKCGMKEKKGGCCTDKHELVKLEDSHKNVYNTLDFSAKEISLPTEYSLYNWQLPAIASIAVVTNHSPPDYNWPDAGIMNCVFRI